MKKLLYLSWESFIAFVAQLDLTSGHINPFTAGSHLPSFDYKDIPLAKLKVLCASWSKEHLNFTKQMDKQHLHCVCSQSSWVPLAWLALVRNVQMLIIRVNIGEHKQDSALKLCFDYP